LHDRRERVAPRPRKRGTNHLDSVRYTLGRVAKNNSILDRPELRRKPNAKDVGTGYGGRGRNTIDRRRGKGGGLRAAEGIDKVEARSSERMRKGGENLREVRRAKSKRGLKCADKN